MKKILFLLLFVTAFVQSQTLQNPTFGNTTTNTLKVKTPPTVTVPVGIATIDAVGTVGKIDPLILPIQTAIQDSIAALRADIVLPQDINSVLATGNVSTDNEVIFELSPSSPAKSTLKYSSLKVEDINGTSKVSADKAEFTSSTTNSISTISSDGMLVDDTTGNTNVNINNFSVQASQPNYNGAGLGIYTQLYAEKIVGHSDTGFSTIATHIRTTDRIADGVASYGFNPNNLSGNYTIALDENLILRADNSAGAIEGFALTNNGNGTVNIATGTAFLRSTNDPYATLVKYTIPAVTNLALTDNATNFLLVDYNGGTPAITVTTNSSTINTETNSIAYAVSRVGTTLDYVNLVGQNVDANAKLRIRFLNQEGIRRANGVALGFVNRNLTLTAGTLFSGLIRINSPAFNTNTPDTFTQVYNNGAVWTRTTGQTQVNNTQYNNAGVLTNLAVNDYRTDWIYLLPNNPSKLYLVLGTVSHPNIAAARAATPPATLPSELQTLGLLVGRSIIQRLGASVSEVASAFDVVFPANPVPNHNDLAGLQLAASGVTYGHITDAAQTIAGVKTYSSSPIFSSETASTIASFDATKNLKSLPLATYPSLTELSYVKGVTSAIQTQFTAKADLASPIFTGTPNLPTGTIAVTQTAGNSTTAVATTAFVSAADAGNVKITGVQSVTGGKTFTNITTFQNSVLFNRGAADASTGISMSGGNSSASSGLVDITSDRGFGYKYTGSSTGVAYYGSSSGSGNIFTANGITGYSGLLYVGQDNNSTTYSVTKAGLITGTSFVKSGATSTDALLAGGGTLANPVSGTGTSGQVSFWSGTTAQTGDNGFVWDNTAKRVKITSATTTPVTGAIRGGLIVTPDAAGFGLSVGNMGDGSAFLQAQRYDGTGTTYVISLNPLGGNVSLGGNLLISSLPTYANDAAADADSALLTKSLYKITGSRAVYQKP